MVCFEILTYSVYMAAMAIAGFGLWSGLFSGRAPVGVTLVPAVFAVVVIVIVASCCSWTNPRRDTPRALP